MVHTVDHALQVLPNHDHALLPDVLGLLHQPGIALGVLQHRARRAPQNVLGFPEVARLAQVLRQTYALETHQDGIDPHPDLELVHLDPLLLAGLFSLSRGTP